MYEHEATERKPNTHPMCTEFPAHSQFQHNMCCYLHDRNLDCGLAKSNGWYESLDCGDDFKRVVIPAVTHKANHVYWQARDITGMAYLKYQSPRGPRHEALVKVLPEHKELGIVVVEGPMCALRAAMHGYIGYALMGMAPSKSTLMHLCLLIEDSAKLPIVVLLDKDSADAGAKVVLFLASQGYKAELGQFTASKDLAALLPKDSAKLLKGYFNAPKFRLQNTATHKR